MISAFSGSAKEVRVIQTGVCSTLDKAAAILIKDVIHLKPKLIE